MPTYEYKCRRCDEVFEVRQRFSDTPLTTHDGCGGDVERLLSAPALQFKGSGWYITDYARNGGAAKKDETKPDGTKPDETKPAEKKPPSKPDTAPAATSSTPTTENKK
jgi:putative FmdB family regulatory protein